MCRFFEEQRGTGVVDSMTFQRVELQRCEIPQEPTDRSRPGVACLNTRMNEI